MKVEHYRVERAARASDMFGRARILAGPEARKIDRGGWRRADLNREHVYTPGVDWGGPLTIMRRAPRPATAGVLYIIRVPGSKQFASRGQQTYTGSQYLLVEEREGRWYEYIEVEEVGREWRKAIDQLVAEAAAFTDQPMIDWYCTTGAEAR